MKKTAIALMLLLGLGTASAGAADKGKSAAEDAARAWAELYPAVEQNFKPRLSVRKITLFSSTARNPRPRAISIPSSSTR